MTTIYWPRRDCRQCGAKNLLLFVLDNDDLCPTCSSVNRGDEPVTEFWPCPECGTRSEMPWWRWLLAVLRIIDWPRVSYVYVVPT